MNVGQRIKQLRMSNDLTQEELASRCELTKGFLSQIENDLTTPSLLTLMDIVKALGTDMSTFFKEERTDQIVFDKEDYFIDEQPDHTITWIVPNAQKNNMEPIIIELIPGASSKAITPQDGEEFGYVLKGTVVLVNGTQVQKIKEGSTFYLKTDQQHFLRNDSSKNAKVLWVSNPPLF